MGRIVALDYGKKRTGVAVSDPLKIIATALDTVDTSQLLTFLTQYCKQEEVETIVIGKPTDLLNRETHATQGASRMSAQIKKTFPGIQVVDVDERFTSKIAFDTMLASGISKKKRKDKALVDKLSATLILQSYLEQQAR